MRRLSGRERAPDRFRCGPLRLVQLGHLQSAGQGDSFHARGAASSPDGTAPPAWIGLYLIETVE